MSNSRQANPPIEYECGTLRQHFNHLRNSSASMRGILSWGTDERSQVFDHRQHIPSEAEAKIDRIEEDANAKQKRNVSFDEGHTIAPPANKLKPNPSASTSVQKKPSINTGSTNPQSRPRSASTANKKTKE